MSDTKGMNCISLSALGTINVISNHKMNNNGHHLGMKHLINHFIYVFELDSDEMNGICLP